MSDGKIIYDVDINDEGIESKVQQTNSKVKNSADTGSSAFGEVWTGALRRIGAGLVELGAKAVETGKQVAMDALDQVSSLEQNIGGVQKLFGDSYQAVVDNANKAFKTAGLSTNQYMETVTGFSASLIAGLGGDTQKAVGIADRAIRDMSDNANTFGTDIASIQTTYQGFAKQNYTMLDNLKLGYGGTKEEMQRLIADASQMTVEMDKLGVSVDGNSMSFDNIINAISVMQTHLKISGTTANEAAGTIEGSVNSMKAAWQNFLAGTIDPAEFAETAFQAAENVIKAFGGILPRLLEGFGQIAPQVYDKVKELAERLVNIIIEKAPDFARRGQEMLLKLAQGLQDGIPKAVEKIMQMVTGIVNWLGSDGGTKMLDSGFTLIEKVVDGLAKALPTLIEYIPQIILGIVNTITNNLPRIIEMGVNLIVSLIQGIWNCVPKLIEQFPTIIQSIFTMWKNTNWIALGTHAISAILNGIAQLMNNIPNLVRNIAQAALNTFKNVNWHSVGTNIINGIINGLRDGADAIIDAAKNVAKAALNSAKAFLGIHSPSRVFKEQVGYQIDAGQAQGIEENADIVEDAAEEVSRKALDASMNVNYNLPNTDSVSKDIGVSFNSRILNTVNRVIEVPLNLNGREIARATAWDMGEQLAWESR